MLSKTWLTATGGVLLAGVLILGPAKLSTELTAIRGLVSDMYDSMRSDDHLIASMRAQLESQHRRIAGLGTQSKKAERQVRAEKTRLASDENRLQILRGELGMAELHLRSASDEFRVGERVLTREQLSSMADGWLAEALAIENRLPAIRDSLAALAATQQTLERQMADARQAWNDRVRDLEGQAARLEGAKSQVLMAEMLRDAKEADLVFQSQYQADQNLVEERIDIAQAQAEHLMAMKGPSQELLFHRSPDAVADRIGNFLGSAPSEPRATSPASQRASVAAAE